MSNAADFLHIDTISMLYALLGKDKPHHPLIGLVDFSTIPFNPEMKGIKITTAFYTISMKHLAPGKVQYGRQSYDFQEGCMLFSAPNQVFVIDDDSDKPNYTGWGLFIHPDFFAGSNLSIPIKEFCFFSYAINEALHLSEKEQNAIAVGALQEFAPFA